MRVVIDTNVVISAFLSARGAPAQLFQEFKRETFDLFVSEAILAEYQRVLAYPRVQARHQLTPEEIEETVDDIRITAFVVEPTMQLTVVQEDPDDDKFVECAVAGGADYIVSGDQHLLNLQSYQNIPIVTPREFLDILEAESR